MKSLSRKTIQSWPLFLGLILGLYFMVFNIIGFDFAFFPGDLGDARFNNYILEHGYLYLSGAQESYWNAPFMYPEENVISYSDNLMGTLPIYSFFRFLNYDMITSFQFWIIVIFILNYLCSYYFFKWLFKNPYAAVLGAFLFTFSIALQSQIGHAQTFPRFFIPIAIWLSLLFAKELNPKYLFGAILVLVMQFYSGIYLGLMLSFPIAIILLFSLFRFKKEFLLEKIKNRKWLILIVGSFLLNFLIMLPLIIPYYERSIILDHSSFMASYEIVHSSVPTIRSFFFTQIGSPIWDFLSQTGVKLHAFWDHQIFPGGMAILCFLLLALAFFFQKKLKLSLHLIRSNEGLLFLTALITFLFFIRFQGYSMYKFVHVLPGFGSMRSIARIINVELIFFALGLGFMFTLLMKKLKKGKIPLFIMVLVLLVFDNYIIPQGTYRTEKQMATQRITELKDKLKDIPEGSVVSYEPEIVEDDDFMYHLDMMIATQELNLVSVNGYTSTVPTNYVQYSRGLKAEGRKLWLNSREVDLNEVYVRK